MSKSEFIGTLNAFDKKTDVDNVDDESVVVELIEANGAEIELAFDDRNERVYVKFRFADLMRAIGAMEE